MSASTKGSVARPAVPVNTEVSPSDFRARLYQNYASLMETAAGPEDFESVRKTVRIFRYHFRDWLPVDRAAPILDAACGAGGFLNALRGMEYTNAVGVDRSPEQVLIAQNAGVHAVEGDLFGYLGERHGAFALISALDIIEHLSKDEALTFVDLCLQALQPEGRLILRTPNGASPLGGGGPLRRLHARDLLHAGSACQTPGPRRLRRLRGARMRADTERLQYEVFDPFRRLGGHSHIPQDMERDRDGGTCRKHLHTSVRRLGREGRLMVNASCAAS
ncbi:hypothetical protein DF3PB_950004 [uncultured Defluviicoccus sp.]|uniref:Methyltransferase domain-containing protein n=1 Tax=metagenome TaxID=256318 RepID=A0A380TMG9_9ZZZZ|nr:hypothetical protein DF3PB_950004 [uncultured Defluviicoccus sp.]